MLKETVGAVGVTVMDDNAEYGDPNFQLAKTTLFDLLYAAGVAVVEVQFDGGGDSGQINSICFVDSSGDEVDIDHCLLAYPGDVETISPRDYAEKLAYEALDRTELDFSNGDGGQGTIAMLTLERIICVEIGINHQSTDDYEFEF
jgi:hypothetical protein